MKLVKSLLLGSAAGLCAVTVAQAADLPMRAAAPVEYVRVCSAHGAGYFYIPGTDTCLRVGGRVRFSYQYMSSRAHGSDIYGRNGGLVGSDNSAFQSLTFLNFDARTATGYGTLRTFIRVIAAYSTGGYLSSGTGARYGLGYFGTGQDTWGRSFNSVYLDKAFIQFAGFTAGRAGSFFDFYAHDLEHFAATSGSDNPSTNLLAYTATFGGGWSATISIEDPLPRRSPVFADTANGTPITGGPNLGQVFGTFTQSVAYRAPDGTLRAAQYDVAQRQLVPDVVAAIRYDAPWGAAQVSAAMHELRPGRLVTTAPLSFTANGTPVVGTTTNSLTAGGGLPVGKIKEEIGWAVQGGLKINLPALATGDVLWLQAAYSEGALQYAGNPARFGGQEALSNGYSGRFAVSTVDSFIGQDGKQKLTEAWSVTGAFLHYWAPQWRTAVFGSYAEVSFGKGARGIHAPAVLLPGSLTGASILGANDARLRDYSVGVVGANLIWSPIKDLDIGLEGVYTRVSLKGGAVTDNSFGSVAQTGRTLTGAYVPGSGVLPSKTAKYDDVWSLRMRVQRDF